MLNDLKMDLRYALRTPRQTPVFTLAAVVVLALGIGVTTALFTVVDAVLLRPLPFAEPDRVVVLGSEVTRRTSSRYSLMTFDGLARQATTLEERLSRDLGQPRFRTVLLGAFGVLALVLAAVGIYGVMSYAVAQRSHEMGVRLALGASPGDVLRLVGQALRRVGLGLGLGLLGALAAHRVMEGLPYGVGTLDVSVLGAVALLLLGTAWLASWLPARRAAGVDPASVLRRG